MIVVARSWRALKLAGVAGLLAAGAWLPPTALQAQPPYSIPLQFKAHVVAYPDEVGYVEFSAQGNRGSHYTVRIDFTGFDIVVQRGATRVRSGELYGGKGAVDSYEIVPRSLRITTDVNGTYRHEYTTRGYTTRVTNVHKLDHQFEITNPTAPQGEAYMDGVARWLSSIYDQQPKHDPSYTLRIWVNDGRPVGGPTYAQLHLSLGAEANSTETTVTNMPGAESPRIRTDSGHYSFQFSAYDSTKAPRAQVQTRNAPRILYTTGELAIADPISVEDMRFTVQTPAHRVPHVDQPTYGTLLSDTDFTVKTTLRIGPVKPVDATLEPVGDADVTTPPEPGTTREYSLTVGDSILNDVDGLRVTIADASIHDGVATNGGNHVRADHCDDCRLGRMADPYTVGGTIPGEDGKPIKWLRSYRHYNRCPIDEMRDLMFRDVDNAGWTFSPEATAASAELKYTAAQQMTLDRKPEKTTRFKVRVMDGAASGRLSAEVRIAGGWYVVEAKGATADAQHASLMVPLDNNRDGVLDTWAATYGVTDAGDDERDKPEGASPGDGLTAFEEYRGVYTRGALRRLNPTNREIFVYDSTGRLGDSVTLADALYMGYYLRLIPVRADEFRHEVINWESASSRKHGDQYVVVLVSDDQILGVASDTLLGKATRVGPPTRDAHTLFINSGRIFGGQEENPAETAWWTLAHEMGHQINMPHHGRGDAIMTVDGNPAWIACLHGEHSGHENCIMRYRTANYFFNGQPVPATLGPSPVSSGQLVPFAVSGVGTEICKTTAGSSLCKDAQPGGGSCLTRIKVRSY